jgi:hypothetical protein
MRFLRLQYVIINEVKMIYLVAVMKNRQSHVVKRGRKALNYKRDSTGKFKK